MFGLRTSADTADRLIGLAGLLAGLQSLRILAEQGVASSDDIWIAKKGIEDVLDMLPPGSIEQDKLDGIKAMLLKLTEVAANAKWERERKSYD